MRSEESDSCFIYLLFLYWGLTDFALQKLSKNFSYDKAYGIVLI